MQDFRQKSKENFIGTEKGRRPPHPRAAGPDANRDGWHHNPEGTRRFVMVPWLFLAVSLWGALWTMTALLRGRSLRAFVVPYFLASWLTSELALHHILWQAAATLVFVSFGALAAWPGLLGLFVTFASWSGLWVAHRRSRLAAAVFESALREGLGDDYRRVLPQRDLLEEEVTFRAIAHPFKFRHPQVERVRDLAYGETGRRQMLDVYRHRSRPQCCPTLLQIHGGGWVIGKKDQQALPLMTHLAARGWVCIAANYRLSPRVAFPDHLIDCKRALAWIRSHGPAYGADPDFVVVTGGSAGGHLSSLVALTANDPELQPGFESVDTSVAACVPFYGVYDFLDRHGARGKDSMAPFLERYVMKCSVAEQRERWEKASPIARVHPGAPPFFVIHGAQDTLAYVEDARHFVRLLRGVSRSPVVYAELPYTEHAFDIFHSLRSRYAVLAVTRFVEWAYATTAKRETALPAAAP